MIPPRSDPLLEGHDPTPGLVAVEPAGDGLVACYERDPADGALRRREAPFEPFVHLADPTLLDGFERPHRIERLAGEEPFAWRAVFGTWSDWRAATQRMLERYNRRHGTQLASAAEVPDLFVVPHPTTQYLLASGRTLFKGLEFDGLVRLALDIETYASQPGEFSHPARPGDRVILVSLADGRGFERLLDGRRLAEPELLRTLVATIRERDPDVLEGHNIFNFDLWYLAERCRLHGIPFAIGRDGSEPVASPGRVRFAERTVDYTRYDVYGRHVLDTWFLVQQHDMVRREMASYGLKQAAQHLGLARPGRTYLDPARLAELWDREPERVARYALDDVRETLALAAALVGPVFYQTRLLPLGFQTVVATGLASRIETLLLRAYLRAGASLPRPEPARPFEGGLTAVYETGVVRRVVKADVESLYPSIMLRERIAPRRDRLGVFLALLEALTARRLAAKHAAAAATDPAERARLDAMQGAFKLLVNAFFGYLGWPYGLWNDFDAALRVTRAGHEVLTRMTEWVRAAGGRVIEIDTDGLYFVPPPSLPEGEAAERAFVERMAEAVPEGLRVAFDGRYRAMLSYKVKNYALLDYDGRLRLVGGAFRARDLEPFARAFLEEAVRRLLEGDREGAARLYREWRQRIAARRWTVADFARTEYLKVSRAEYERQVTRSARHRAAVYELARRRLGDFRRGEALTYYITGRGARVTGFDHAKLASEWDPAAPDENVEYYLRKLDEVAARLAPCLPEAEWQALFGERARGDPRQMELF
ncbi:MAG TPA: DNA polymerase domain-containing protein [Thermodesulfobacteriota bacterium]|nr:DNA polymerase domain-containing protein [Thermodesulfobacteriota bacterium]